MSSSPLNFLIDEIQILLSLISTSQFGSHEGVISPYCIEANRQYRIFYLIQMYTDPVSSEFKYFLFSRNPQITLFFVYFFQYN